MQGKQASGSLNRTTQEGAFHGGGQWSMSRVNQPSTSWQAWSLSQARVIYAGYECQQGGQDLFAAVACDKWKWKALLPLRFLRVFSSDSLFFLISCLCIVALRSYSALAHAEVQSVLVEAWHMAISNHSLTHLHPHICFKLSVNLLFLSCLSVHQVWSIHFRHTDALWCHNKFQCSVDNLYIIQLSIKCKCLIFSSLTL